jgi:hypothetical protein
LARAHPACTHTWGSSAPAKERDHMCFRPATLAWDVRSKVCSVTCVVWHFLRFCSCFRLQTCPMPVGQLTSGYLVKNALAYLLKSRCRPVATPVPVLMLALSAPPLQIEGSIALQPEMEPSCHIQCQRLGGFGQMEGAGDGAPPANASVSQPATVSHM